MIIEPIIDGVVARSSHPLGCQEAVRRQISTVKNAAPIKNGAKKVLILGASSGFGLASRIALAFGGSQADTIGVSFERGPSDKGVGTAGWYNNIFFKQEAEQAGLTAKNFIGDAFSPQMRQDVIHYIQNEFGGKVDAVIYSLATGMRPNHETGEVWRSSIKTIGSSYTGNTINIEKGCFEELTLEPATPQEIENTIKVMGGEDWENWIDELSAAGVLAQGCQTFAYSYVGPKSTYPIYHQGTLGQAKKHLHQTADKIEQKLSAIQGHAYVAVCKALVTKASVFIPALSEYILALYWVMKEKKIHEGCIEQMQRLFADKVYGKAAAQTDVERLIRIDDWEMREDVQQEVSALQKLMTADNFKTIGDYQGYVTEFLQLNGFAFDNIDYQKSLDIERLKQLKP
ncbi:MAG: enoyl-ACP reductase FabV [Saezia sp.]